MNGFPVQAVITMKKRGCRCVNIAKETGAAGKVAGYITEFQSRLPVVVSAPTRAVRRWGQLDGLVRVFKY
jgi:hypothetical protein